MIEQDRYFLVTKFFKIKSYATTLLFSQVNKEYIGIEKVYNSIKTLRGVYIINFKVFIKNYSL